ncbi:MAG: DUF3883 domain-containing protein [Nanoarchaeota archaeon]
MSKKKIMSQGDIRDGAVRVVEKWYKKRGWKVTKKGKPYDLLAKKGNNCRYVEVKGTMNQPTNFRAVLSKNEKNWMIAHRKNYRLHIVAGFAKHKNLIHKSFSGKDLTQKPKPTNHYYITVPMKK